MARLAVKQACCLTKRPQKHLKEKGEMIKMPFKKLVNEKMKLKMNEPTNSIKISFLILGYLCINTFIIALK